jgi:APA family basic amino acid/polyamine antiporter
MPQETSRLVRAVGRWSLAALMFNTVIGAGIFGLPSLITAHLGRYSPLAYVATIAGIIAIAACLAEVASQFSSTGGLYLYTRAALGPFWAIQIGWLTWLARIAGSSAGANLFLSYLAQFFPGPWNWFIRVAVLMLLIGLLAAVNYRGVGNGARVSNFFAIVKILLIVLLIGGGALALLLRPGIHVVPQASAPITSGDWFTAILLLVNGFAGFESALTASGETRDIRKDAPFALMAVVGLAFVLTLGVQCVVMYTLPGAAASSKPVADAAQRFLGPAGGALVAICALISIYGYLGAGLLHTPRVPFAMAEQGDFPRFFAAVHPRFRTPHYAIVTFALLLLAFSILADFRWNATISGASRLFMYGSVVVALPLLRRKHPHANAFRLRGAGFFVLLALLFVGLLVANLHRSEIIVVAVTFVLAALNWAWTLRSRTPEDKSMAKAA